MDSILTVKCEEPEGVIYRRVRQMLPDPAVALRVFDKLQTCPSLFEHWRNSPKTIETLLKDWWKFYLVDDVGLLCFDPLTPTKAHVHITFWDKRLRGREELCRAVARYLISQSHTDAFLTAIPVQSRVVTAFAKRVGFQQWKEVGGFNLLIANAGCFTMKQPGVN